MRTRFSVVAAAAFLAAAAPAAGQQPERLNFITASGNRLMDGAAPFRFVSFNIPNLNFVEDEFDFLRPFEYRLPDEFELRDAYESVRQMGGTVVRMYTFPVRTAGDPAGLPRYVLAPGKFDETSFRTMDLVLSLANEYGVRLIVPLLNNWQWMGGRPQYAAFRGKTKDDFWTDPQLIADFKQTVAYVLNRRNTITGVAYKDDPAILCWETGNELQAPQSWTKIMAAYIKSIDRKHLLMDGAYLTPEFIEADVANPNIDILTTHHYEQEPGQTLTHIEDFRKLIHGRKPYVVGEVGFFGTGAMQRIYDKVIASDDISGVLIWSLRHHRREGGFYWHSEPDGRGVFKAFHVPGFASGDEYDETNYLAAVRQAAFRIRALPQPRWPVPAAPKLLPIADAGAISWQGSAGAADYQVERAEAADGPWQVVGLNVSDAAVPYMPLFADQSAETGKSYFYRVIAENVSGRSAPSNAVGPVAVAVRALVDDMRTLNRTYRTAGKAVVKTDDDRRYKELFYRVQGEPGAELVYTVPGPIGGVRVFSFSQGDSAALSFAVSSDGTAFEPVAFEQRTVPVGGNDYGYWHPILFEHTWASPAPQFLRIHFDRAAQVGRVEIRYGEAATTTTKASAD